MVTGGEGDDAKGMNADDAIEIDSDEDYDDSEIVDRNSRRNPPTPNATVDNVNNGVPEIPDDDDDEKTLSPALSTASAVTILTTTATASDEMARHNVSGMNCKKRNRNGEEKSIGRTKKSMGNDTDCNSNLELTSTATANIQAGNVAQVWICEVCKLRKFSDYDEALAHEKFCPGSPFNQSAKMASSLRGVDGSTSSKLGDPCKTSPPGHKDSGKRIPIRSRTTLTAHSNFAPLSTNVAGGVFPRTSKHGQGEHEQRNTLSVNHGAAASAASRPFTVTKRLMSTVAGDAKPGTRAIPAGSTFSIVTPLQGSTVTAVARSESGATAVASALSTITQLSRSTVAAEDRAAAESMPSATTQHSTATADSRAPPTLRQSTVPQFFRSSVTADASATAASRPFTITTSPRSSSSSPVGPSTSSLSSSSCVGPLTSSLSSSSASPIGPSTSSLPSFVAPSSPPSDRTFSNLAKLSFEELPHAAKPTLASMAEDLRALVMQNLQLHSKYALSAAGKTSKQTLLPRLPQKKGRKHCGIFMPSRSFVQKKVDDEFHVTLTDSLHKVIPSKINREVEEEDLESVEEVDRNLNDQIQPNKANSSQDAPMCYEKALSSYRDMFCRQCTTFDCHHHIVQKYDAGQQAAIALAYGKAKLHKPPSTPLLLNSPNVLTEQQKFITSRLWMILGYDTERLSDAMGGRDIAGIAGSLPPTPMVKLNPNAPEYKENTKRTCGPDVRERLKDNDRAFYYPCHHAGPCNVVNCTCIQEGFVCTKQCINGKFSKNYFPGCHCTSGCKTDECPCRISDRECDLDLCKCRAGCCNKNITFATRKLLLLAQSTLPNAGWGLFTKDLIKKGEFIDEVRMCQNAEAL